MDLRHAVADERKAPAARVVLLRLVPGGTVGAAPQGATLAGLLLTAGACSGWTLVDVANPPVVDAIELDPASHWKEALALLDEAETGQMASLRDTRVRQSYVYAHAALRLLLSRELGTVAPRIRFSAGRSGKPRLAEATRPIHFSLSRRPGVVALALGNAPLGVDVELIRSGIDIPGIGQRFFTQAEQAFIASADALDERVARFFSVWSRKEALVKAAGVGVDALEVADALKSCAELADENGVQRAYCLHQLQATAADVLAMAIELPGLAA